GSQPNSKLADEQDITLNSFPGKQVTVDLPDDQRVTRRIYLAENRVYILSAQHGKGGMGDADKFFESFKITYNPPNAAPPKPPHESPTTPPPTQVVVAPPLPKGTMPKGPVPVVPLPKPPDPAPAPPAPADFVLSNDERAIVDEINKLRAGDKVAALKPEKKLFDAARAEAVGMGTKEPVPPTQF